MLVVKNLPANAGHGRNTGLIAGLGRSHGERNSNLLQYSCLENSMDRGAWWTTVHGVAKSQTQLSDWACTHTHTHTHTVAFQCCVSVYCTAEESVIRMHRSPPFWGSPPCRTSQSIQWASLCYALGSHLWEESEAHPHPTDNWQDGDGLRFLPNGGTETG